MQTYFPSLDAIHQQTMQLACEPCQHCGQAHQLVSHGFIRKKQPGGQDLQPVGKRVFCSNRYRHTGCGRTTLLAEDWLPPPRILHPWPDQRFDVKYPRWEPSA